MRWRTGNNRRKRASWLCRSLGHVSEYGYGLAYGGCGARIGHDIGDFADLLVRKAEKANDIPRDGAVPNKPAPTVKNA